MKNMQHWEVFGLGIIAGMTLLSLTAFCPWGKLYKWDKIKEKIDRCEARFEMKCGPVVLPWIPEVEEMEKKYNEQ